MNSNPASLFKKLISSFLIILSIVLFVTILFSLRWRYMHDSPIMFYLASLMDSYGWIPYRDFFDMNMPGTYFAYSLLGRLFGFGDIGVRLADLCLLAILFFSTWIWIKQFGKKAAWAGCVLWGLAYLRFGPALSLQREYLVLVLIVLAIVVSIRVRSIGRWPKYLVIGLLFGLAFTIKPHSSFGFPLLLIYESLNWEGEKGERRFKLRDAGVGVFLPALLGFGLPVLVAIVYLWINGALTSFYDIIKNYLPLYLYLTKTHETISGMKRYLYLISEYRQLGGFAPWIAAAAMGSFVSLYHSSMNSKQKREVVLLIGFVICYSLYPLIAGQFWAYHWILFLYFVIQLSVLCLGDKMIPSRGGQNIFIASVLVVTLIFGGLTISPIVLDQMKGGKWLAPKGGRVDEIAEFLRKTMQPQDTVQPLDWTGGAVHAMLISGSRLATPFVYDFHFYHHVSHPYIQKLRAKFIEQLERAKPRFIIQFTSENKPWVSGEDTTREFVELQSVLERDYKMVLKGDGYIIYERGEDIKAIRFR